MPGLKYEYHEKIEDFARAALREKWIQRKKIWSRSIKEGEKTQHQEVNTLYKRTIVFGN